MTSGCQFLARVLEEDRVDRHVVCGEGSVCRLDRHREDCTWIRGRWIRNVGRCDSARDLLDRLGRRVPRHSRGRTASRGISIPEGADWVEEGPDREGGRIVQGGARLGGDYVNDDVRVRDAVL